VPQLVQLPVSCNENASRLSKNFAIMFSPSWNTRRCQLRQHQTACPERLHASSTRLWASAIRMRGRLAVTCRGTPCK